MPYRLERGATCSSSQKLIPTSVLGGDAESQAPTLGSKLVSFLPSRSVRAQRREGQQAVEDWRLGMSRHATAGDH
jgi:hypothetical protein